MRAWWLIALLATAAVAQEGQGAAGKGEDPAALLVRQLKSPDAAVRAKASRNLGREGRASAIDPIRALLDDPDASVRAAAATALVRLDAPEKRVEETLVSAIRNPDWYTRWDACLALGMLGPAASAAMPALLAAAGDKDLDITREAVVAILRIAPKDPQVLAGLVGLLDVDTGFDRRSVLRALEDAGQIELAKDWLARELIANRYGLRGSAAALLGKCGVGGLGTLQDSLASPDPFVRASVICQLGFEEKIDPGLFLGVLKDPEAEMRRAAINALVRRTTVSAAPDIAVLLSDESAPVRLCAARALLVLETRVPEAGPGLVRLVAEGDRELAMAALAAMRVTGFAALAMSLDCREEHPEAGNDGVWAVRLRPRTGTDPFDKAHDHLIESLEDNKHGKALVTALREVLAKDEDAILVAGLTAEDAALRRTSATLLGYLGRDHARCTRALEKARKDEDKDVRAAAEQALTRLRSAR